jgi:hypothetical protein
MRCTISQLYLVRNSTCFRKIYCPSSGVSTLYSLYSQRINVTVQIKPNSSMGWETHDRNDGENKLCDQSELRVFARFKIHTVYRTEQYLGSSPSRPDAPSPLKLTLCVPHSVRSKLCNSGGSFRCEKEIILALSKFLFTNLCTIELS